MKERIEITNLQRIPRHGFPLVDVPSERSLCAHDENLNLLSGMPPAQRTSRKR